MAAATDQRLERAILASERAGKVVVAATIGPDGIRLEFGAAKPADESVTAADLRDWSKFR